ncbi:uncharacterized protein F4807DRAFT_435555 [Annulohypoxylon truncatum]|uniref:uncharacterized protein n=1 Tax=Annulohypoxylon truncatum TaxID=327061 RepID=UPI002007FBB8|nr:uncharacterized protein F4807DRAFT_435555 [Annulohypoxylon truncatum]KAI1207373.1 hypothetical protein F4807DRAFT_435555 [Annulohypoxylon truncatum]
MSQIYSSAVQPIFGSTGAGVLRQIVPNVGRAAWRRAFVSKPQQSRFFVASRIATHTTPRPTISNIISNCYKASLRSTRRSFHRTSRLRDAKSAPKNSTAEEPQGITAKLKKLSREYGWAALGVYLGLTVLDFPFCFLLVRSVGTEKIGEIEHYVVSNVSKLIPQSVRNWWKEYREALRTAKKEQLGDGETSEHDEVADWGVEEAEKRHKAEASLGTQLALAYAIHKSFIFLRVPLTAAITPKVVKVLRSWGWKIGKRSSKR